MYVCMHVCIYSERESARDASSLLLVKYNLSIILSLVLCTVCEQYCP
jgi:hypothetical protein